MYCLVKNITQSPALCLTTRVPLPGLNLIWTPINPELERGKSPPPDEDAVSARAGSNFASAASSLDDGSGDVEEGGAPNQLGTSKQPSAEFDEVSS